MVRNRASTDDDGWREVDELSLTPILTAALNAFYENGFHGTTVRDIAGRVGVTVPALYYHHANKEAILFALLEIASRDTTTRVEAADAAGDDPIERMSLVTEVLVVAGTRRSRLSAVETESRYLSEPNLVLYNGFREKTERSVRSIVEDGNAAGLFHVSDAATTTRAILGMMQSISRWYDAEGHDSPEAIAAKYVEIVLQTLGVPPADAAGSHSRAVQQQPIGESVPAGWWGNSATE
jgi:AcrR family transcriptional regulator